MTYFKALKTHYSNEHLQGVTQSDGTIIYPSLDARKFKELICNRTIEGANRNITMNHICDRIDIGYAIYDLDPDSGDLEVCRRIILSSSVSVYFFPENDFPKDRLVSSSFSHDLLIRK